MRYVDKFFRAMLLRCLWFGVTTKVKKNPGTFKTIYNVSNTNDVTIKGKAKIETLELKS